MEEDRKLLNDLDVREIFERQSDARTTETMAASLTAVLASAIGVILLNGAFFVGRQGIVSAALLCISSGVGWWLARALCLRLEWLEGRCEAAARRLQERNALPDVYRDLAKHAAFEPQMVFGTLQSVRARVRLRILSHASLAGIFSGISVAALLGSATLLFLSTLSTML